MGRWKAWALAWLLAAILSALLLQAPSARGDQHLVNGGFEDELGGEWRTTSEDDAIERVCTPEAVVHGGECAGRVTCHGPQKCEVSQAVLRVGYGQYYELRAHIVQSHEGATTLIYLDWYESSDSTGTRIQWPREFASCTEADDEPYDCLTTGFQSAPSEARSARVKVVTVDPPEGFTLYLDDFSFTGPPAPTPTPTPSPTPTPTPSPTPSPSPSPSPTATPSPTASLSPTATPSPTVSPSSGPIASPIPAPVASPSPTAVPTATKAPSASTPTTGLVNGSFEEADDEGRPLGWRKYGGELARSSAARWEGQFAAAFISRTTSTKWAFQTVAIQGGKAYVLSGYALKNDANVEGAYLRLSWYASPDGSGRAIDSVDSTTRLTDDSPDFRLLTTGPVASPAEAASAKVRLMLDPVSEAEGKVYFDAISFEETTVLPPTQTPVPSPPPEPTATPPEAAQMPLSSPSGDRENLTPSAPAEQPDSSPSPTALRPSPTVLGASSAGPEATASSPAERLQTESPVAGRGTGTPVILYRERRSAQSTQGGESVAAGGDEGDGLSPIVLALAAALPAVAALGAGSYLWWRAKRARPP